MKWNGMEDLNGRKYLLISGDLRTNTLYDMVKRECLPPGSCLHCINTVEDQTVALYARTPGRHPPAHRALPQYLPAQVPENPELSISARTMKELKA